MLFFRSFFKAKKWAGPACALSLACLVLAGCGADARTGAEGASGKDAQNKTSVETAAEAASRSGGGDLAPEGGSRAGAEPAAEGASSGEAALAASAADASAAESGGTSDKADKAEKIDFEIPEEPYLRDDGGVSMDVFAMDTYMNLLAYGDEAEEAIRAAAAEIHRLDDMLSTGNADSEIARLNAAGTGAVSATTAGLIARSLDLYGQTEGLFDIAIYPVMQLWGFPTQDYRVPEKAQIEKALQLADASKITIKKAGDVSAAAGRQPQAGGKGAGTDAGTDVQAEPDGPGAQSGTADVGSKTQAEPDGPGAQSGTADVGSKTQAEPDGPGAQSGAAGADSKTQAEPGGVEGKSQSSAAAGDFVVSLALPGMEIDLGGIAKGYTSGRVMEIFAEYGIEHGLVSLGGNVQAYGSKTNGKPWRVAIQNPESELEYLGVLSIADKAVITSGGYERFFEQGGVRYHHIIDPRTGFPADSGILSATIISADGALADGLSTSLFIMGREKAESFWRAHADEFDFILEDSGGTLYVTEGAADILETDARTEIIRR